MFSYFNVYKRFIAAQAKGPWRFFKGASAFLKSIFYYFTNRRITSDDYAAEYNSASSTYSRWTDKMGKHTDGIIDLDILPLGKDPLEILDLACGQGYVTNNILHQLKDRSGCQVQITAVDNSEGQLRHFRRHINDQRVDIILSEAITFLKSTQPDTYHAVFIAWVLPYFHKDRLLPAIYRVLKKDGMVYAITHSHGTLADIEQIFLELVARYPDKLAKVLDVSFNLPDGKQGIKTWFEKFRFSTLKSGDITEKISFDIPHDLYQWLRQTGAIAGTGRLFNNIKELEPEIIREIEKRHREGDKYVLNYRFTWGIFKK